MATAQGGVTVAWHASAGIAGGRLGRRAICALPQCRARGVHQGAGEPGRKPRMVTAAKQPTMAGATRASAWPVTQYAPAGPSIVAASQAG
jgi:hypothetical protein